MRHLAVLLVLTMLCAGLSGCSMFKSGGGDGGEEVAATECEGCTAGAAGDKDVWCKACEKGYVSGKETKCHGCYVAKTGGVACPT